MLPAVADAHGFGRLYNLPVPFWLYAWAASAALLLSFLLVAIFATTTQYTEAAPAGEPAGRERPRRILRALSVFLLLLCVATGLFGNQDPYRNFCMTFFWVIFTLGFTYLTALAGDVYASLNPWRTLSDGLERLRSGFTRGRFRHPQHLGDWPALALYLAFISFELFGHSKPFSLAVALSAYTLLNLAGVWLVGAAAWFRHCEFFSLFFHLVSRMAPLRRLSQDRPLQLSTTVFALGMLSTTAFDGLRATQGWVRLYWSDPTGIVRALSGDLPIRNYAPMLDWYMRWESFCLLLSPFLYFAGYAAAVALGAKLARSPRDLRELLLDFGYTLLPIALVYSVAHYATLLLSQGLKIVSLFSDPFGWGWNLFGTAALLRAPILPPMSWVWHSQVALILLGHIISVYAAHRVALRVFPTRGQALLSQLPMLALMMGLTVSGLWILAQPLTVELMR